MSPLIVRFYLYVPGPKSYKGWLHSHIYTHIQGTKHILIFKGLTHGLDLVNGSRIHNLTTMLMGEALGIVIQVSYLGDMWLIISCRFYGGLVIILVDELCYLSYPMDYTSYTMNPMNLVEDSE